MLCLFRAGFHSFDLEGELTRNRISFVKYGGFKFLESLHIKDVLAHLKVVNNPKDRLSWIRILRLLPGIGMKTAMKLAAELVETGFPKDPCTVRFKGQEIQRIIFQPHELLSNLRNQNAPISEKVEQVNSVLFSVPSGAL